MTSKVYSEAQQKALEAIESDHEGYFLCTTRVDENDGTDIEVITEIDSGTIEEGHGLIRLEQAAMHLRYLSDISGIPPTEVAGSIATVIENGEIDIEIATEMKK